MKAGWTTKRLEELVEIRLGRTPPRAEKNFWDPTKATDNTWVSIADLSENEGGVITESKEHLSKAGADSTPLVKAGTLLVSFKLSLGKVAIAGKDLRTNEAIAAMPIKGSGLDVNWLKYFFQFFDWDKAAVGEEKVKGKALNKEKLKEIEIPLPPLAEQKRIVALLDEAFAGIDEAKAKATASQHDAEELISEYVRSTFSDAGIEWRETTLGEAFDVRDGTHDSPKYHTTGHPLVTSKNLKREGLSFEDVKLISRLDFAKINERSAVSKGDVLFAMIGTIGNPTLVEVEPDFAIKNVALFKNRNGQSGAFLKHYLNSSMVVRKMMKEAKGTTQRFVGLGYLRSFPIKLPPIETQLRVVRELNDIEDESRKLTRLYGLKYAKLDDLKQSFLSQAFAGELTA